MPNFKFHVFVCTNRREDGHPKGSCAEKGSEEIREYLKKEVALRGLKKNVRINNAGCLDECARGPAVVVYPEGTWYRIPTVADAQEFVEQHLTNGVVVERLKIT